MRCRPGMTESERARISADTKARMANPAVRQRIRDGMQANSGELNELRALRAAWRAVRPAVRNRFIHEIFASACSASGPNTQQSTS
jgi:hypothetical protein